MAKATLDRAVGWTRERLQSDFGLLATVSLALIGVPAMLSQVVQANAPKEMVELFGRPVEKMAPTPVDLLALAALTLAILLGSLTLARMLMAPGETVRDSLGTAGRRFGPLVGAVLLIAVAALLLLLLVSLVTAVLSSLGTAGGAVAGVLIIALAVVVLLGVARLTFVTPAAVEPGGAIAVLRRCWERGRGLTGRLLVLLLVTALVGVVVVFATQLIVGIPTGLIAGRQAGVVAGAAAAGLASALTALVTFSLVVGLYVQTGSGADEGDVGGG